MKVRKFLFAGALLVIALFSVNSVMAQTTDDVTVNLIFRPIQTITVNADSVNIIYATSTDYSSGKTRTLSDHITICSTGGFEVNVKASEFSSNGSETIPVGEVQIVATEGSQNGSGTNNFAPKASLTTLPITLLSATGGGTAIKYNVEYDNTEAGADNAYIDMYKDGATGTESVYSTTVTYTIAAK